MNPHSGSQAIKDERAVRCWPTRFVPQLAAARSQVSMVTLLMLTLLFFGCSQYGQVSPKAYQISSALYSVCNRKDPSGLDKLQELIGDAVASDELSSSEERWLMEIVESGRSGDWESAAQDARTMMEEQIQ